MIFSQNLDDVIGESFCSLLAGFTDGVLFLEAQKDIVELFIFYLRSLSKARMSPSRQTVQREAAECDRTMAQTCVGAAIEKVPLKRFKGVM